MDEDIRRRIERAPWFIQWEWGTQWWPCEHSTMACNSCASPRREYALKLLEKYEEE